MRGAVATGEPKKGGSPVAAPPVESVAAPKAEAGAVKLVSQKASALIQMKAGEGKFLVGDKDTLLPVGARVISAHDGFLQAGKVRVILDSDIAGDSPMPVVEAGVVIDKPSDPSFDAAFQLERGRVDLQNTDDAKPAKVHVRLMGEGADIELSPGARVAIETYGRFLPGTRFDPDTKPETAAKPFIRAQLVVLKGEVTYKDKDTFMRLNQPPGKAQLGFDSELGNELVPAHLDKIPSWAIEDPKDPEVMKHHAMIKELEAKIIEKGDIGLVIDDFAKSEDPRKRIAAIYLSAATDDLARLFLSVSLSPQPDVVDEAIVALRHWLGRAPGQDQKLYEFLMKGIPELEKQSQGKHGKPFSGPQAVAFIDLLFGFSDAQKEQPATYRYLLKLLSSDRTAIRGLASWYLNHMIPEGIRFGFNANGPKEVREAAIKQWETRLMELKKLPEANLPPRKPLAPKKP